MSTKKYDSDEIVDAYKNKRRQVITQKIDWPITSIFDAIVKERSITLNPEFQRNYVWQQDKASQLIESILLNIPLPTIYISEDLVADEVVDGQQRLTTIISFVTGKFPNGEEFRLTGLKEMSMFNGARFVDLPRSITKDFNSFQLSVIKISDTSHSDAKFEIFERINRGSVALNENEIRNCLYRGELINQIKALVKTERFQKIMGFSPKSVNRMEDVGFVSNYLAFSENGGCFKGSPKTVVNRYMAKYMAESERQVVQSNLAKFMEVLETVYRTFGQNSFRRFTKENPDLVKKSAKYQDGWEVYPGLALFLSKAYAFSLFPKYQIQANADVIRTKFVDLMTNDEEFNHSLKFQTTSDKAIILRIEKIKQVIAKHIVDPGARVFPRELREELFMEDPTCKICQQQILDFEDSSVDHIVRWADGGTTTRDNAQLTHILCNQMKG